MKYREATRGSTGKLRHMANKGSEYCFIHPDSHPSFAGNTTLVDSVRIRGSKKQDHLPVVHWMEGSLCRQTRVE